MMGQEITQTLLDNALARMARSREPLLLIRGGFWTFRRYAGTNWPAWHVDVDVVTAADSAGYFEKSDTPADCLDSRTLTLAGRKKAEDVRTRRGVERAREQLQKSLKPTKATRRQSGLLLAEYKGVWVGTANSPDTDLVRRWVRIWNSVRNP